MKFTNPIIFSDYSDPDVIRVGENFFMVASSFNYSPALPVLHSVNGVEWRIVNYVAEELPFEEFSGVRRGEGVWAPSLRFHDGIYYCVFPIYGKGIFVSETRDPFGKWSEIRPLVLNAGLEDPCPLWDGDKCYLIVAFAKSKAGFNSRLAIYETDVGLTRVVSDGYKFVYDGTLENPTIEGPKLYKRGGYYYIMAPAGGVEQGWQTCLRSRDIYGPYESKRVLFQGDTQINGPHQGALVGLEDGSWAFYHFQHRGAFGRIVHVQPVVWRDEWPICGDNGQPVTCGEIQNTPPSDLEIQESDDFSGEKLSLMWQTPANMRGEWYSLGGGLRLNCVNFAGNLCDMPNLFTAKLSRQKFTVRTECEFTPEICGDEAGFGIFGEKYAYVCAVRRGKDTVLEIRQGTFDGGETVVECRPCDCGRLVLEISARESGGEVAFGFTVNSEKINTTFTASQGRWVGAKVGIYARNTSDPSQGFALFKYFETV
ncbi:MAG: glycoside hydrolase 43 family protein [Candidatus Coproplasma sp.]